VFPDIEEFFRAIRKLRGEAKVHDERIAGRKG
jgi:hypothetical protein